MRFITPRVLTNKWRGQIDLPHSPDSVAIVRGLLLQLTRLDSWEQLEGVTISPEDAVLLGEEILASFRSRVVYIGQIIQMAGESDSPDILPCDGRSLLISQYPELYDCLGVTWGSAGSGTFRIPDLRAKTVVGAGNGRAIGESGGAETVVLSIPNLPVHDHPSHTHLEGLAIAPGELPVTLPNPIPWSTGTAGSGTAHENMPPFAVLQSYIIAR